MNTPSLAPEGNMLLLLSFVFEISVFVPVSDVFPLFMVRLVFMEFIIVIFSY